jgi:hypothetical protein
LCYSMCLACARPLVPFLAHSWFHEGTLSRARNVLFSSGCM